MKSVKESLFVWDENFSKVPVIVTPAVQADLENTDGWQTQWTTKAAISMPNKVALKRADNDELLGLMSYEVDHKGLAVKIIYLESADHSNKNLLKQSNRMPKYHGIAKALFAYAIQESKDAGFGGVLFFRAKTTELVKYYMQEFGAVRLGQYDPFQMIIWDEAAEEIISDFKKEDSYND